MSAFTAWAQTPYAHPDAVNPPAEQSPAPIILSPVIWSEHPEIVQRFNVRPEAASEMLNAALLKLTSASTPAEAWQRLGITPDDVVGIKITATGGPLLATHRPLIESIISGLRALGVPANHIIIWDKEMADLRTAGFEASAGGPDHVVVTSVFPNTGYDVSKTYMNELLGSLIWGDYDFIRHDNPLSDIEEGTRKHPFGGGILDTSNAESSSNEQTSNKSYFARLETQICTKIINVPVLTDNSSVGIQGCLSSLALASVDNNRRFQGEPTYGETAIPEILSKDFLHRKVVLHVLDALIAEYAGGPDFQPQYCEQIGAIYLSRDPVAIDSLVLPRLEKWRAENHIDRIGRDARHIHSAASYNLGTDDPSHIQLIHLP